MFKQGDSQIVARMQGESVKFYGMAGRGATAPGCVVIRRNPGNDLHPFVVHFGNTEDGGYYYGDYCSSMEEAEEAFDGKVTRYDPGMILNQAFIAPAPRWHGRNAAGDHQGLITDEATGATIAVTYDTAHTALVAAAPTLHHAAKEFLAEIDNGGDFQNWERVKQQLRDAVQEAEA